MRKFPVIVFEGIETSGKSTLINKVSNYLKKIKRKFIKIREPGGSVYSEIIRKLMLNNKSKFNFITDFMLVMASRSENIDKILKRNHGKNVVYSNSTDIKDTNTCLTRIIDFVCVCVAYGSTYYQLNFIF